MIRDKVIPVRRMGYIETGEVCSLAHYFHVPKGPDDIRMVYNGTGCGLNASLWAPHFGLPYVTHTSTCSVGGIGSWGLPLFSRIGRINIPKKCVMGSGIS